VAQSGSPYNGLYEEAQAQASGILRGRDFS